MTAAWRPMTETEVAACLALREVTFLPASPPKRLARSLISQAGARDPLITDRQAECLWRIVHRFRRQINDRGLTAHAAALNPRPAEPVNNAGRSGCTPRPAPSITRMQEASQ